MDDDFDDDDAVLDAPMRRFREPKALSVTEVTRAVRDVVEGMVGEVWVEGEIGNYRRQASGHQYFTLKDDRCQLSCVLFQRGYGMRRAQVALREGMQVQVRGTMTVYEARGQYQLNVAQVQVAGEGALAAKFEALKRKLAAEGLFDRERKRPIPRFPATIGVVTSPTGAVIRDILHVLERRAPWIRVMINPVRVQGAGAAREIAAAVTEFHRGNLPPVEVIVVARGGGSAEDLWEFNEEVLARAIAASPIPVVSAVGHEIDFSISDFVADLRAPTPSAAAELIAPDTAQLLEGLTLAGLRMERRLRERIDSARAHLGYLEKSALFREPRARLEALMQQVDLAGAALARAGTDALSLRRQQVEALGAALRAHRPDHLLALRRERVEALTERLRRAREEQVIRKQRQLEQTAALLRVLGPQSTLSRGYSITQTAEGKLLRTIADAAPGDELVTRLADGEVRSTVQRSDS